jgi:UDP-N-acetylglucosamine 4,6-dehydratase (inverting)
MKIDFLKNKSLLITGGTGSFGKALVNYILKSKINVKKIIIFSRDELKQLEMSNELDIKKNKNLRFFIGDVRDKDRLFRAMEDVDFVIHAAALKQVLSSEYNPIETIKTNILGAQNIIESSIDAGVKKVIGLSTDKAVSPINLYGATKLCAEKLFVSANNIKGKKNILFSCVRYGNVFGSRGSVVPIFVEQLKKNYFTITDTEMTRFVLTINQGVELVLWTLKNCLGSEIVIPKIPSVKIINVGKAINSSFKQKKIGIRLGEKVHEDLMTEAESSNAIELVDKYILLPSLEKKHFFHFGKFSKKINKLNKFSYSSNTNNHFLNIKQIRKILIKEKLI